MEHILFRVIAFSFFLIYHYKIIKYLDLLKEKGEIYLDIEF